MTLIQNKPELFEDYEYKAIKARTTAEKLAVRLESKFTLDKRRRANKQLLECIALLDNDQLYDLEITVKPVYFGDTLLGFELVKIRTKDV